MIHMFLFNIYDTACSKYVLYNAWCYQYSLDIPIRKMAYNFDSYGNNYDYDCKI